MRRATRGPGRSLLLGGGGTNSSISSALSTVPVSQVYLSTSGSACCCRSFLSSSHTCRAGHQNIFDCSLLNEVLCYESHSICPICHAFVICHPFVLGADPCIASAYAWSC